jgi:hypothetical protein
MQHGPVVEDILASYKSSSRDLGSQKQRRLPPPAVPVAFSGRNSRTSDLSRAAEFIASVTQEKSNLRAEKEVWSVEIPSARRQ